MKAPSACATTKAPPSGGDKEAMRENLRGYGMTPTEEPDVIWNFEKFLISRDGEVVARFAPAVTPDDPTLVEAVEHELGK